MRIIFAGGGTAGHVNPAIAAANYISRQESSEVRFCGGRGNIEETLAEKAGYPIDTFPLTGLSREKSIGGLAKNACAIRETLAAISACKKIVREFKPDLVMGTGGYASFPMVYAAAKCGVKTAILEVNATPGIATKLLAKHVDCVMLSYAETEKLIPRAKKFILTGSPVREEILRCRDKSWEPLFPNKLPTLCCFWGSVGALYMNRKMEEFLVMAARKREFNVLYAAGAKHYEWMRKETEKLGLDFAHSDNVDLRPYIYDMDRALACADLFLCRAGGTLAELCAAGRPSVLVPSPFVAENHQEKNARILEKAGAAVVITEAESTAEHLYDTVLSLLQDPPRLARMGENACGKAQPQALANIYKAIKGLL
ncbi:MAG: UDP-N-acetylglucosamine--N-acetylmuramyl-(pentapeptide) pyrophosphoryl-undecaprenol N-acetylglucosamine transferase [Clostridiaceae bacterium]|nr:UDP-N-acetylglucosamine--N-acetylmuramyl-(pentapeptide) pyrophosphoryl-undecaprenol N-acetylglucosamine transferase [Clostridiaceae bacterium]